jgi:hypothetical protein
LTGIKGNPIEADAVRANLHRSRLSWERRKPRKARSRPDHAATEAGWMRAIAIETGVVRTEAQRSRLL